MTQTGRLLATTILLHLPFSRKGPCSATQPTKTSDLTPQTPRKCKLQVYYYHHHPLPNQAKKECFYNPASPTSPVSRNARWAPARKFPFRARRESNENATPCRECRNGNEGFLLVVFTHLFLFTVLYRVTGIYRYACLTLYPIAEL